MRDRYGAPPPEIEPLLAYAALRIEAERLGLAQVDRTGAALLLRLTPETRLPAAALVDFVRGWPGATLQPDGVLRLPLRAADDALALLREALLALAQRVPAV